ncbi:MAG: hypothetical protein IMZ61_07345, partial [Planctomycetes bacterium]|nr:hypothetical protein [Planctomycetota bacterium]
MTWAYQPMTAGLAAAQNKDWVKTATLISQSSARDPSFTFYQTDAGLAWSRAWLSSGDPQALQKARLYLEKSLEIEPSVSLLWADLAVLHWYGGDRPAAFNAIRQAIRISPSEPSYHLNLAWFEEQTGENQLSAIDYQKVLDLSPSWSTHPFFSKTSLRRLALEAWKNQNQALIDQAQS